MLWSGGTNTWSRVRRTPGSVHQVLSPQTPLKKISHLLVSNILQLITNIQFCQKYPVKTSSSFRCNTGTQSQTVVSGFTLSSLICNVNTSLFVQHSSDTGQLRRVKDEFRQKTRVMTRLKKEATEQLRAFWITTDCCFSMCSSVGTESTPGPDDIRGPDGSEPGSRSETVHFFINSSVLTDMKPVERSKNWRDVIHSSGSGTGAAAFWHEREREHDTEHVEMLIGWVWCYRSDRIITELCFMFRLNTWNKTFILSFTAF